MAEAGKPGTNWRAVTPENRRKVSGLVRFYMKKPHPFTACVRDNTKRFGPERAKRVCAVVKDLGHGGTGWRKGGKAREDEVVVRLLRELREASELVGGVESVFGEGAAERLAEGEHTGEGWEVVLERLLVDALALLEGWETLLAEAYACPACGRSVPDVTGVCPYCGAKHVFRPVGAVLGEGLGSPFLGPLDAG